jgi:hypothetical protein
MLIFDYNYEYAKYFSVCLKNEQNIICELLLANEKSWIDYEISLNKRDVDFSKKLNDLTENFVNATLFGYSYSIHFSNEYSNHILIFSTNNHEITIYEDYGGEFKGLGPKIFFSASDKNLNKVIELIKELSKFREKFFDL